MAAGRAAERDRLAAADAGRERWREWGPYLAERAWGTVREDYSPDGGAWGFFPHDHARSRAYRCNEDGMAGVCDAQQTFCLGLALWNGVDPILKERMFGLTGLEGNHGEDVKDYWWYLDSTPTNSWMSWRYHYPQREFPYPELEHPTGSGQKVTLTALADDLCRRLIRISLDDPRGRRPVLGDLELFQSDSGWHDLLPFHEYFHGDTGRGLGASHQTGWTGLVADLILGPAGGEP
jgi:hypothetical protein